MSLGSERQAVQDRIIDYSKEIGWDYVNQEEALRLRGGETGFVFNELFINQIQKLNHAFIDHLLAEELIKRLERIPPTIEGNLIAWEYLKGLQTVFVPDKKREMDVNFIDTANCSNNTFHVTDEFTFTNGSKTNRPDIVYLINGLPVLIIETKAAHEIEGISKALVQIKRYHRQTPELMVMLQIYALTHPHKVLL